MYQMNQDIWSLINLILEESEIKKLLITCKYFGDILYFRTFKTNNTSEKLIIDNKFLNLVELDISNNDQVNKLDYLTRLEKLKKLTCKNCPNIGSEQISYLCMNIKLGEIYCGGTSKISSYIWEDFSSGKDEKYIIHDDGRDPFKVKINRKNKIIGVFKKDTNDSWIHHKYKTLILLIREYENLFIPSDEESVFIDNVKGNSILINVKNNEYILIECVIRFFKSLDKIKFFYSKLNISDESFPYAYSNKYIYQLLDMIYIKNDGYEIDPYVEGSMGEKLNFKEIEERLI